MGLGIASLEIRTADLLAAKAELERQQEEEKVKISDRVFAMLGPSVIPNALNRGFVNNNLVIIGDKGVILVDAGSHKAVAKHIYKSIKKITDKPITHIIITHHHADHHLGAQYFFFNTF